ncbi:MAG: hypothetical protein ACP5H8_03535, partial [Candidatus Micrarchaeia archaeon]
MTTHKGDLHDHWRRSLEIIFPEKMKANRMEKLKKLGVDVEGIQKEAKSQKAREQEKLNSELLEAAKSG